MAVGWSARSVGASKETTRAAEAENRAARKRDRAPEDADAKVAARWMERLGKGKPGEVAAEVPTADLRSVIAGVMGTVWGELSEEDQKRLEALIGQWAIRDRESALAWARSLHHPLQREVGLTSIAAALAESDPKAAFDIYAEQDKVTSWLGREKIHNLITALSKDAVAKGPQALLDLIRRIPENETNGIDGVSIRYPDGFDYAAMLDGLAEIGIGIHAKGDDSSKPYEPESPLGQWAVKDPDAAFSYFSTKATDGYRLDLGDLTADLTEKWGRDATRTWLGEKVSALDSAGRKAFLEGTGVLNSPSQLIDVINGIRDPSLANEFRYEALQATSGTTPRNFDVLADLPLDEKLEIVTRLRGMKQTGYLQSMLTTWEVPRDRIDSILKDVSLPPEPASGK